MKTDENITISRNVLMRLEKTVKLTPKKRRKLTP